MSYDNGGRRVSADYHSSDSAFEHLLVVKLC